MRYSNGFAVGWKGGGAHMAWRPGARVWAGEGARIDG